MPGSTKTAIS